MIDETLAHNGQCQCGNAKRTIQDEPLVRIFCHCTICQEFNAAAYSDVTIFLSKDVQLFDETKVNFKQYTSSPAIHRGKCSTCEKPAIEYLDLPIFPSLAIVPSENIRSEEFLLEPSNHVFYHSRVADIDDGRPKHSGFLKSQTALAAKLLPGIFRSLTKP